MGFCCEDESGGSALGHVCYSKVKAHSIHTKFNLNCLVFCSDRTVMTHANESFG
jgi:hypothetical protein